MKSYFLSILLPIILASCNTQPEKEPRAPVVNEQEENTEEKVDTLLTNETILFFNQSGYGGFAKTRSAGFDWSKFKLIDVWKEDSLLVTAFNPDKTYFDSYGRFLKYSPDSSLFVDLDSYNIHISKDKQGRLIGNEEGPDTEISLVDWKKKEKTRLLFLGPGSSVEEGGWMDEDNIVLMGLQENAGGDSTIPVVWKYHVPTNTFYLFQSPDTIGVQKQMYSWRKERLKGVTLQ